MNVEGAPLTEPAALVVVVGSSFAVIGGSITVYNAFEGYKSASAQHKIVMQQIAAKNSTKDQSKDSGIIYERTNPKTGEKYYGQAKDQKAYLKRQKSHNKKNGIKHTYRIVERGKPGKDLDVKEENWIRRNGGPNNGKNNQGTLANRRHQMSDKRYEKNGGLEKRPASSKQKQPRDRKPKYRARF